MELQVTNSPFNQEQVELLNRLLPNLTDAQRIWLSGYLTALQGATGAVTSGVTPQATLLATNVTAPSKEVTILFGSQTGNSHGLAKKMSKKLEEQGFHVTLSSMGDFKPNGLKNVQNLLIVVSTHGEGEPPDNAIPFYEFLHSKRAPQLESLRFSVLALGDTSYEFYCQTGKDFDKRLEELGGKRLTPRIDCDVDYDEPAAEWMNQVLGSLSEMSTASTIASGASADARSEKESEYSRTNPFQAEVLENLNLNGRGSDRETRHIELSLEGSNLQYEPGDSVGIYPENNPRLVDELIEAMGWRADELVPINKNGDKLPLREALLRHYEITVLTKPLLTQAANFASGNGLKELLESGREQELRTYMDERDLLDLVQDYSLKGVSAGDFVTILRKIPARLYSIASSSKAFPDEVHVTVRTVRYEAHGRDRYGVCSVQLAERVQLGEKLPVYIQQNSNFKLPENQDTPIIMIGPGTGVAPFRAFLGEREEIGAKGKTWLFYGDQHFSTDFLYQIEWQHWLKDGVLTRMDVAFSRDTDKKVYVQHRMLEKSGEFYKWLQEGAVVYVCGDEKKMAHDVHAALLTILQQEGSLSPEEAAEYLTRMQQHKRYQRDVY
ncbi:assimilatory sulfite reductase (NADPH) flavoprotein subunit [Cohnella silvisoli]|uniref:Assimilatory sulfite reductase (NADPH) flavoprotein subunit n=1 Tax=Cohnella silvisoli TaxID=2873699 RepID=A0ABV1KSJ9_9BACL|nr:assimilatory sulfite reductase (NADPH) flavoprotein subunit [Cohnella silvisoli]MCD9022675.1 assimilatory sulfite reductase (NADPH) flavoprotein subunit [Cohnella silvisoli]